jgi:hypothetical protein
VNVLKRCVYGSEIGLSCLGIIAGLVQLLWFISMAFHAQDNELAYWLLLLGPELILLALASIPVIILGLCGLTEYRILSGRIKNAVRPKILIYCALFLILAGMIFLYPYSSKVPIPGLNAYAGRGEGLSLLVNLYAGTLMSFLYLPVFARIFAIVLVWTHLLIDASDLAKFAARMNRSAAVGAAVLLLLPVLLPLYFIRASSAMVPPQTLSASTYFVRPVNLGLPSQFAVRTFRWDDRTKGFDATAGLWLVVDDGHTRAGVAVAIAIFPSQAKSSQRYDQDLRLLRAAQAPWARGRYKLYVGEFPLGDEAFINLPRPGQLETRNANTVLTAYWHDPTYWHYEGTNAVPPYVVEIVKALSLNVRQGNVR